MPWAKIEKCSVDTALLDITDLVERGVLKKDADGGRSASYSLAETADACDAMIDQNLKRSIAPSSIRHASKKNRLKTRFEFFALKR